MNRKHLVIFGIVAALAAVAQPIAIANGEVANGEVGNAPAPCANAEHRQFDFLAGDWDTYDIAEPSKVVARNHVSVILDSCVVLEEYEQTDGMVGKSYSIYDAGRRRWHQSWVTNRGALLLLDGGIQGDSMVLTGTEQTSGGRSSLLRGVWWKEGRSVRERADRSSDGGKSWEPVFDIVFRPHEAH